MGVVICVPVGYDVFQVVGQHLAPDVNPADGFCYFLALDVRDDVSEAVAAIYYQAAQFGWVLLAVLESTECAGCGGES